MSVHTIVTPVHPSDQVLDGSLVLLQVLQTCFCVLCIFLVETSVIHSNLSFILPKLRVVVNRVKNLYEQPPYLANQVIVAFGQTISHDSRVMEELLNSQSNFFLVSVNEAHMDQIIQDMIMVV